MTADFVLKLLENHGVYVFAIATIGWAYWQERKQNIEHAKEDREVNKAMVTALVEVKMALQSFKDMLENRFPRP